MQEGTILRNNYRLDRLIGRGGMAEVYLAFDARRQTHVALKILRDDLAEDPEFVRRFTREAEALARLDHPNIVRFYSFERQGAIAFIVMDFVAGTTLQRRLAETEGPLPPGEVTYILQRVGAALQYAHSMGYIHRDIKPGNIMLREDGNALLSDFGIARVAESATLTTVAMGTPAYMSPEQILGHELDRRTDIYSLGIVLYEMAAGRRPFTGDERNVTGTSTLARLREAHLKLSAPDPRSFNPNLPAGAAEVILRALAKNPAERWPDVLSMVQQWENAVGRPVVAPAPPLGAGLPTPARATPGRAGPLTPAPPDAYTPPPPVAAPRRARSIWPYLAAIGALGLVVLAVFVWRLASAPASGSDTATPTAPAVRMLMTDTPAAVAAAPTPDLQATVDALVKSTVAAAAPATVLNLAETPVGPNLQATVDALVKGTVAAGASATLTTALQNPTATPPAAPSATPVPPTATTAPTAAPPLTATAKPTAAPQPTKSNCPAWFQRPKPGMGILVVENHVGKPLRLERIGSQDRWDLPAKQGEVPGRLLLQLPPGKHEFMDYVDSGEGHIMVQVQAGEMWVSPIWFNNSREEKVYPLEAPPGC